MAICQVCGQRLAFGRSRHLRACWRIAGLVDQLEHALRRADDEANQTPPVVRSALLSLRGGLAPLVAEGSRLVNDIHEAAHDRRRSVDRTQLEDWEAKASEVLREILTALNAVHSR